MRKFILFLAFIAISAIFITYSCSSDLNLNVDENAVVTNTDTRLISDDSTIEYCGDVKVVRLLAGQHYEAGTVTVGNDYDNLYVTYETTNGWNMKGLHLFVGDCDKLPTNKPGNLVPGQFPYKVSFDMLKTIYTFVIPLEELPDCYCVAAHANVVKLDSEGEVIQSETAFGEGEKVGKNWFMKFDFCIQACDEEPPGEDDNCWQEETAWGNGIRYVKKGNWAMYTPYFKDDAPDVGDINSPVELLAGQHHVAGEIVFSAVTDGKITITITLKDGWELQDVGESVKIQGYATSPPSKNPAPGQFEYKGTKLTLEVDFYRYYGIHLDVRKKVACE